MRNRPTSITQRAKKAPQWLPEILAAVNLIPPDAKMPNLYMLETGQISLTEAVKTGGQEFGRWVFDFGWNWLHARLPRVVENPEEGPTVDVERRQKLSWSLNTTAPINTMAPWDPVYRYLSAITWRETLLNLAHPERTWVTVSLVMERNNDDGQLKPVDTDPLGRILLSVEFDSRYVLQCAVETCRRVFWASKLTDKELGNQRANIGCNPTCKNVLRVRRHREGKELKNTERALRNERWRANYKVKYKRQRMDDRLTAKVRRFLERWEGLFDHPFDCKSREDLIELAALANLPESKCRSALRFLSRSRNDYY